MLDCLDLQQKKSKSLRNFNFFIVFYFLFNSCNSGEQRSTFEASWSNPSVNEMCEGFLYKHVIA